MKNKFPFRFFIVAFAWTWLLEIPLMLCSLGIIPIGEDLYHTLYLPVIIIATFGPGLGAFYSLRTLEGKGSVRRYLRGLLDFRLGWRAWVLPIAIFGGTTCLAWILPELWGAPRISMLLASVWLFPVYYIVMILVGGGQEELGWRGYILDPMEERLGPWLANLVLGVVWAVWHLPLFFTPGATQSYISFWGFLMMAIGYCWIFSWIPQISGKRTLSGLFVHGTANVFIQLFPTILMVKGVPQTRFWIWASMYLAIGITVMVVRTLRARRTEIGGGTGLRTA